METTPIQLRLAPYGKDQWTVTHLHGPRLEHLAGKILRKKTGVNTRFWTYDEHNRLIRNTDFTLHQATETIRKQHKD
jgi:hypothetical protein